MQYFFPIVFGPYYLVIDFLDKFFKKYLSKIKEFIFNFKLTLELP